MVSMETVERVKVLTLLPHFIDREQLRFIPTSVFPTPPFTSPEGWDMTKPNEQIPGYEFAKDQWFYLKSVKLLAAKTQPAVMYFVHGRDRPYILEVDLGKDTSRPCKIATDDSVVLYMQWRNSRHRAMMTTQALYGVDVDLTKKGALWTKWGCKVRCQSILWVFCEKSV